MMKVIAVLCLLAIDGLLAQKCPDAENLQLQCDAVEMGVQFDDGVYVLSKREVTVHTVDAGQCVSVVNMTISADPDLPSTVELSFLLSCVATFKDILRLSAKTNEKGRKYVTNGKDLELTCQGDRFGGGNQLLQASGPKFATTIDAYSLWQSANSLGSWTGPCKISYVEPTTSTPTVANTLTPTTATEPPTMAPLVTVSPTIAQPVTETPTTIAPPVTEIPTIAPPVTVPPTVAPPVTVIPTIAPPVTEPPTIAPPVTDTPTIAPLT